MSSATMAILVAIPVWLMGILALVDVIRRRDLGRGPKVAWAALLVLFTPVTLVYLVSRPVGDVGVVESRRIAPDDPRVRLTVAVERGDLDTAAFVLAAHAGARPQPSPPANVTKPN